MSTTDPIVVALIDSAKSLGRAEWLQQSEVLGPAYAEDVAKCSANLSAVLAAARAVVDAFDRPRTTPPEVNNLARALAAADGAA